MIRSFESPFANCIFIADRLVPVPSLFFIGEFGQPIEIVAGNVESVDALNERIAVAEGIFYKTTPATPSDGSAAASSSNPATTPIPPPVVQSVPKPVAKKVNIVAIGLLHGLNKFSCLPATCKGRQRRGQDDKGGP